MFFILSKVLGFLIVPSNFLIVLGIAGIALLGSRFFHIGRSLLLVTVFFIALLAVFPIGSLLLLPLENRFPQWNPAQGMPSGIIVLGGAIDSSISAGRNQIELDDAADRITSAVELARKYPTARIVFSGGNGDLRAGPPESDFAVRMLENLGVPRERIRLESQSRNTAENAAFTKRLIDPKPGERWLLVTSARHMPRAIGSFRQAGFPVEAYPVDYQLAGSEDIWTFPGSLLERVRRTDMAVREWLGLLVYWVTGRISTPFPKPVRNPAANLPYPPDQYVYAAGSYFKISRGFL
jgi:uncharacterized SAM-binding protein YcdF (DUF218 family)